MNDVQNTYLESNLYIENREKMRITGVKDVDNFDDNNICVKTQKGDLIIGGEALKISKLDVESGEMLIDGKLDSFFYQENAAQKQQSFFGRVFK